MLQFDPATGKFAIADGESTGYHKSTVADDSCLEINIPADTVTCMISDVDTGDVIVVWLDRITPAFKYVTQPGIYTMTTGPLTGLTGLDEALTISIHTDSTLYIENRLGTPRSFVINLLGLGNR